MTRFLMAASAAASAAALHPRPAATDTASWARWLVHESDYGIISTLHEGAPFGNVISISDGNGYEHSTGVIYTYIPTVDATYHDVVLDDRVSVGFSEKALAGGDSAGCKDSTAEDPPCGRLTISGRLTRVPTENRSTAMEYLLARHPVMEDWGGVHGFIPFWLHPDNITDFFVINTYGGAKPITVSEYLDARWYREDIPSSSMECQRCGYLYDADADGEGVAFDELPDDWCCPICGSPKSHFQLYNGGSPESRNPSGNGPVLIWAIVSTVLFVALLVTVGVVSYGRRKPSAPAGEAGMAQSLQPRQGA